MMGAKCKKVVSPLFLILQENAKTLSCGMPLHWAELAYVWVYVCRGESRTFSKLSNIVSR